MAKSKSTTKTIYEIYVGYYGAKPTLLETCSTPTEVKVYLEKLKKPYAKTRVVARRVLNYERLD